MLELHDIDFTMLAKWDQIVYSCASGTIFHTLNWLRLLERNQAIDVRYIGIFMNKELIGVFPLCTKKFMFFKVAGSPFFVEDTPYMGPVIAQANLMEFFTSLNSYLKLNRFQYLRMILNQPYDRFDNLIKNENPSYQFFEKETCVLDLTKSEEDLWNGMEGRCRTAIRKAKKSNVIVKVMKGRNFIDEFYSMLQEVFLRYGKSEPTNSKAFYYDMWDTFGQRDATFLAAEYLGQIIAGAIVIFDRKKAYYLSACSKTEFSSLSANNLIQWQAIKIAKENGVEHYDLLGPNSPTLTKFKESFGSLSYRFTSIERSGSNWISLIRDKYPYYKYKLRALYRILKNIRDFS